MSVEDRNIAELARDAAASISQLASDEMRLAAAEMHDSIEASTAGLRNLVIGAALLIPGIAVVLVAAAIGLRNLGAPDWAAFLAVGLAATAIGFLVMQSGKSGLNAEAFLPKKTFQNLRRDAQAVKGAIT